MQPSSNLITHPFSPLTDFLESAQDWATARSLKILLSVHHPVCSEEPVAIYSYTYLGKNAPLTTGKEKQPRPPFSPPSHFNKTEF